MYSDILKKINLIDKEKKETQKKENELKKILKKEFCDKNKPLKDRLQLYFTTSLSLKEKKSYCYTPSSKTLDYFVKQECNECYGRKSLIIIDDIERYEEVLDEYFNFILDDYTEEQLTEAFEELLSSGYGSYVLDW